VPVWRRMMMGETEDKRVQWRDSPPRNNVGPVQAFRVHEPIDEVVARDRSSPEGFKGKETSSLRKTPGSSIGPVRPELMDLSSRVQSAVSGVTQIQLAQMDAKKWQKRAQVAREKIEQLEAEKSALGRKHMLKQVSTQTAASQGAQHKAA
jgi:hypothetical protein